MKPFASTAIALLEQAVLFVCQIQTYVVEIMMTFTIRLTYLQPLTR
jgi:hypothetical protein